jgi:hypothetical protein
LPLSQQQHDPLPLNQQQQQQQDKLLPDQQQQQQQEWRLKSGLLGHDYPPALPQTPNSSSTGGGRVVALGFGPYELADEEQWENVKTWLIQVRSFVCRYATAVGFMQGGSFKAGYHTLLHLTLS